MRITLVLNILGWIGLAGGLAAFFIMLTNGLPRWREEVKPDEPSERFEGIRGVDKPQRV